MASMTSLSAQGSTSSYGAKSLCRLVGAACLAGFLIDMLVLAVPPNVTSIEWRIGFLQQMSDRSIILLFGLALLMYGILDLRLWRKRLALTCLVVGGIFTLSSILVIRDSLVFQQLAFTNISNQAAQVRTQLDKLQENPSAAPNLKPEQLKQVPQLLDRQVESLKQNAQSSVIRTGIASVGNLVVVGIALIGLGQFGIRSTRN
ncbi:HpsJ-like protein, cyanoexosortase C-associated [Phormidesmis sp. 146-33]